MKKLLYILCLLILIGCTSNQSYKEGTIFDLGLYLPYEGSVVGVQVVQYLNGCKISASTNSNFQIERQYTSSNCYFGVVQTQEQTHTKVKVEKQK